MKLQIKTLTQKSLSVEIEAEKTVLDLKKELELYADIGVSPEQQKLIYAGKILENNDQLCNCNIDEKKFLVVMIVKAPVQIKEEEATATDSSAATAAASAAQTTATTASPAPATNTSTSSPAQEPQQQQQVPRNAEQDEMVTNIVSMGYPESDVRQALEASFNNPERAVEYLIEGIPISPNIGDDLVGEQGIGDSETDASLPFELLRSDPVFRNLRSLIQQNPDLIDEAVSRIGEANPSLLNMINDHQQEFLDMLFEPVQESDDEDDVED